MKRRNTLLSLVILSFSILSSQGNAQLPEGVNVIQISTSELGGKDLFKKMTLACIQHGYSIDFLDKELMIISTNPRSIETGFLASDIAFKMDIVIDGETAEIRGWVYSIDLAKMNLPGVILAWERTYQTKLNKSIWFSGWNEQLRFVREVNKSLNGEVTFKTEIAQLEKK